MDSLGDTLSLEERGAKQARIEGRKMRTKSDILSKMGVCAHRKDHEEEDLPSLSLQLPANLSAKRNIHQHLLDLKKIRQVPLLSLADNPLYLKRIEGLKAESNSNQSVNQTLAEK